MVIRTGYWGAGPQVGLILTEHIFQGSFGAQCTGPIEWLKLTLPVFPIDDDRPSDPTGL